MEICFVSNFTADKEGVFDC